MKKEKKQITTYIMWGAVIFLFFSLSLYTGRNIYKKSMMRQDPSFAKAIITGANFTPKMGTLIKYKFEVTNQIYEGSCVKKKNDFFTIGDSCLVIYDSCDISRSEVYRDRLGYLHILSRKDSLESISNLYLDSLLYR